MQPALSALSPAMRKLRPSSSSTARLGPAPPQLKNSLFVFVMAAAPIDVRTTSVKFERRRKRKLTARSFC